MKVSNKNINLIEDDLDLFNEDDWSFLAVDEDDRNFKYFCDSTYEEFSYDSHAKVREAIKHVVMFAIACILVAILIIFIYFDVLKTHVFTNESIEDATSNKIVAMEHISGNSVSSEDYIEIQNVLNKYFQTLNKSDDYTGLNDLCTIESNFYNVELSYRSDAKFSFDEKDCYARALRYFGRGIALTRINDIQEQNGVYYCYVNLNVPNLDKLFEYYISYKYEMTKHFSVYGVDTINVTRFLLDLLENNQLPIEDKEFLFKITKSGDSFYISDDSQITSLATEAYNESVANIISILGEVLSRTQYSN